MPIFLVVALGYASPENADDFKTGSGIISAVVKQVTGQTYDQALGFADAIFLVVAPECASPEKCCRFQSWFGNRKGGGTVGK